MMKNLLFIIAGVLLLSCAKSNPKVDQENTLPFFNTPQFTPEWIAETDDNYDAIHKIPDFTFINQEGKKVSNKDYQGKIYIADFFFITCPGICPILEKNMSKIQDKYKNDKDILLLSHTVTPWMDSVPELKKYAERNDVISGKWNLVTGNKDELYNIARKGYFADQEFTETNNADAFIHSENFILIDKKGRIRGVYNGTLPIEVDRLIRHIGLLKKEG